MSEEEEEDMVLLVTDSLVLCVLCVTNLFSHCYIIADISFPGLPLQSTERL
jgi:hypothetical protein